MKVIGQLNECRDAVLELRDGGRLVGLVPTMGALHTGHRSLIAASRARCDATAVSIFVNPTQFGPQEDFENYPRTLQGDLDICRAEGVDLVFVPAVETMYKPGASTVVHVAGLSDGLCGRHRPGHFDGVSTVVAKLFHILPANKAFFGEKDYQQLLVIRRMARDLNLPIEVVACPTVREPDGLALSSRNAYLTPDQRTRAASLSRSLFRARDRILSGERKVETLVGMIRQEILDAGPADIDYVEIVDEDNLQSLEVIEGRVRICLAVHIGPCRLIDNVGVDVGGVGS